MLDKNPPRGWRQHINPDGSIGAWIHASSRVEDGAVIPATAVVQEGAQVRKTVQLEPGDLLTESGSIVKLGRPATPMPQP